MAENRLSESARQADSMPVFASERGKEREPLTEAPNGENRAPRRCGAFLGARGPCVLSPNHTGDHTGDQYPKEPPIRTEGMPLSQLPPCLVCHGFLGQFFHVLDLRMGVIDGRGAREVAGLALDFGFPIKLAEVFSSQPEPVKITDDPRTDVRVFLCGQCFAETDLPMLMEKINRQVKSAERVGTDMES